MYFRIIENNICTGVLGFKNILDLCNFIDRALKEYGSCSIYKKDESDIYIIELK